MERLSLPSRNAVHFPVFARSLLHDLLECRSKFRKAQIVQTAKNVISVAGKNSKNDSFLYCLILFNFALKGVRNLYTPAE